MASIDDVVDADSVVTCVQPKHGLDRRPIGAVDDHKGQVSHPSTPDQSKQVEKAAINLANQIENANLCPIDSG